MADSDTLQQELDAKKDKDEDEKRKLQEAIDARKQEEEDAKKADDKEKEAHGEDQGGGLLGF